MRVWFAVVMAAVFGLGWAWEGAEHSRQREMTVRYAKALAECANGGQFNIGNRILHCVVTDVAVY